MELEYQKFKVVLGYTESLSLEWLQEILLEEEEEEEEEVGEEEEKEEEGE